MKETKRKWLTLLDVPSKETGFEIIKKYGERTIAMGKKSVDTTKAAQRTA